MSKVLERIVQEQTIERLDKYNILYKFQSEFWETYSTVFCTSYITDKIPKAFDYALLSRMILIDFQKSFDTTDHNILLIKVPSLGFSLEVIDWYKSYLSSRKFHVNVLFWTFVISVVYYRCITSRRLWSISLRRWYVFVIST